MRRVITYGTFDLLHYGHINLLRRAKEQGDYLIVALSTDEFNWNEKQKKSYFSYEDRKRMLEAIRYVDLVIPEESWDQKITDVDYHVDVFVIGGDDWKGKFDFLKDKCEVVYLPRTPEISTTKIEDRSAHLKNTKRMPPARTPGGMRFVPKSCSGFGTSAGFYPRRALPPRAPPLLHDFVLVHRFAGGMFFPPAP